MKKIVLSLFLVIVVSPLAICQEPLQKFIEVTGRSERDILPDNVEVTITLNENENVNRENDMIEREKKMMAVLKEFAIPDSDIGIDRIAGSNYGYNKASIRYNISKIYKVQVKKIDIVDNLIIRLFEAGVSGAQITKLSNKDLENFKSQAAVEASTNARLRAEAIAKTLNATLGAPLSINELNPLLEGNIFDPDRAYGYARAKLEYGAVHRGQNDPTENVNMKKIHLTYSVAIRFELR